MTTVQDDILASFFDEISKAPAVNEAMVASLRLLLEGDSKPKVEELIAAFSIEKTDDGL
jgi:hypothetical protein